MIPDLHELTDFLAAQPLLAGCLVLVFLFGSMFILTKLQGSQARRRNDRENKRRAQERFRFDGA